MLSLNNGGLAQLVERGMRLDSWLNKPNGNPECGGSSPSSFTQVGNYK